MAEQNCRAAAKGLAQFYEGLNADSLKQIGDFYASSARFKDPFNEVQGLAAIEHIFVHMFATVSGPRFVVNTILADGMQAMLSWDFHLKLGQRAIVIRGASHVVFDAQGLVSLHRDYWDSAEELYAKLPVLGSVMRFLQRKLSASSAY